jgi:hypothetical protein
LLEAENERRLFLTPGSDPGGGGGVLRPKTEKIYSCIIFVQEKRLNISYQIPKNECHALALHSEHPAIEIMILFLLVTVRISRDQQEFNKFVGKGIQDFKAVRIRIWNYLKGWIRIRNDQYPE